jgi:hypothetical protein
MSTSSSDGIFGLATQRLNIGSGSTLAELITQDPGQNSLYIEYFSGGTVEIIGVTAGTTLTAAQLGTANGTGFIVKTDRGYSFNGPTRFYLSSTGATSIVHIMKGKTTGT